MTLPEEAIDEFIKIYKKEFCKKLSRAEAREMAEDLITLYKLIARKLPDEQKLTPRDGASEEYHQ